MSQLRAQENARRAGLKRRNNVAVFTRYDDRTLRCGHPAPPAPAVTGTVGTAPRFRCMYGCGLVTLR